MADIKGFDVDVSPDALGREGRAPVPAEGTLLLADEVDVALAVLLRRGAGGGHGGARLGRCSAARRTALRTGSAAPGSSGLGPGG